MPDPISGRPLWKKLGIKAGFSIAVVQAPHPYTDIVPDLPKDVMLGDSVTDSHDLIHVFTSDVDELRVLLPGLMQAIRQDGSIWVSWPKKASGLPSTVDGNAIRDVCLPLGLVDVKVCSVDAVWSGLKLVIRVENRTA